MAVLTLGCPSTPPKKTPKSTQNTAMPNAPGEELPSISLSHVPSGAKIYKHPDKTNAPLNPFFTRLHALRQKQSTRHAISIVHVGDSHVASDTMTGETRRLFQNAWGAAGRGYIYPGRPWRGFRQEGVKYSMGGKWDVTNGKSPRSAGPFGFGGIRITSTEAGDWFDRRAPSKNQKFHKIHIHYLSTPGAGSFNIYIDDAEKPIATVPTALVNTSTDQPVTQQVGVYTLDVKQGAQSFKVEAVDEKPVTFFGTRTARNDSGIVYHSLGLNGARAKTMLAFSEDLSVQELGAMPPDLFIFGFGTNEAYNWRNLTMEAKHPKVHRKDLTALIKRYKQAAPQAACLVLLPMEFAVKPTAKTCYERKRIKRRRRWRWVNVLKQDLDLEQNPECAWTTPPSLNVIRQASIDVAHAQGCAMWDQYAAMGGQGSMRNWAQQETPLSGSDGVHLRLKGYQTLGQMLYLDLMRAYQRWEKNKDATLLTTPWVVPIPKKTSNAISQKTR